jgi:hypothetical protein
MGGVSASVRSSCPLRMATSRASGLALDEQPLLPPVGGTKLIVRPRQTLSAPLPGRGRNLPWFVGIVWPWKVTQLGSESTRARAGNGLTSGSRFFTSQDEDTPQTGPASVHRHSLRQTASRPMAPLQPSDRSLIRRTSRRCTDPDPPATRRCARFT